MPLDKKYDDLKKVRAKVAKTDEKDPKKGPVIKKLDANLNELKQFADQQKKLQKELADLGKLKNTIDKFKKSFSDYIKQSVSLSTEIGKLPDTPQRTYFQIASQLSIVGTGGAELDLPEN
jgi:predicted  nucleic acid-binding Zn-ribbon protein